MRIIALFLCLFISASAIFASPLAVRTGEHEAFTRVVVFTPVGAAWDFGRDPAGYVLRLPDAEGYDISGFFDIIPRSRIASVSQSETFGELSFTVSCVCHARPYMLRDGILVIDFFDGPPKRISSTELSLTPPVQQTASTATQIAQPAFDSVWASVSPVFMQVRNEEQQIIDRSLSVAMTETGANDGDSSEIISVFEKRISEALGNGLTGGLLEVGPAQTMRMAELEFAEQPTRSVATRLPGTVVRTSVARRDEPNETQSGLSCLPDRFFAVSDWGDDREFGIQIAEARAAVYDDRDKPDPAAVVLLAQTFVYFGFGDEARQALRLDDVQSQERYYLDLLAQTLEGFGPSALDFEEQVSCNSSVALWALLASSNNPTDAEIERDVILKNFRELPNAVRDLISPRLAQAFMDSGDIDASHQIISRIQHTSARPSEAILAEVALSTAFNEADTALLILENAVTDGRRISSALLEKFFQNGTEVGRQFTEEEFALSAALRFELADSEGALDLSIAQLRAHIAMNQFDEAYQLKKHIAPELTVAEHNMLEEELAKAAVAEMTDGAFGRFAWTDAMLPEQESLRMAIAARLIDMGFTERAEEVLGGPSVGQNREDPSKTLPAEPADTQVLGLGLGVEQVVDDAVKDSDIEDIRRSRELAGLADMRAMIAVSAAQRQALVDQLNEVETEQFP